MRVIAVMIAVGVIPVASASASASPLLTLGSRAFQERAHGTGIGHVRPSRFSVDGFPIFDKLQWKGWGADVTLADGENLPDGPTTSAPARVQLRAYDVGGCDGSAAYRKVKVRAHTAQGWTAWRALDPQTLNPGAGSTDGTLCLTDTGGVVARCKPTGPHPRFIAVLVQGINSANPGSKRPFNPSTVSYCGWPDGNNSGPPDNPQQALRGLADGWLNYSYDSTDGKYDQTDPSTQRPGHNLLDRLAAAHGYVLPLSYVKGTAMTGTVAAPRFTVPAYNKTDVANARPNAVADYLNSLISSIKRIFPTTTIVVVGHSNGGLIAEQWWLNHRPAARGIKQVFSLDSPLNGLFDAAFCSIHLCGPFGVSAQLGDYYSALWSSQSTNDPYWATLDAKDKAFTAVGSYGDPLYDMVDNGATALPTTDARIGIVSQLYFTEPSCATNVPDPFDLSTARCRPTGRYFVDPCAPASKPLDIEWGPPLIPPGFGAPGSLWMHSVVKNCPGVASYILSFATPAARTIASKTSLTG